VQQPDGLQDDQVADPDPPDRLADIVDAHREDELEARPLEQFPGAVPGSTDPF
jgi:hypothetical protein